VSSKCCSLAYEEASEEGAGEDELHQGISSSASSCATHRNSHYYLNQESDGFSLKKTFSIRGQITVSF